MKDTKTMLEHAREGHSFIKMIDKEERLNYKDILLVQLQQCIEKYLKHLLREKTGESNKTHNITSIYRQIVRLGVDIEGYETLVMLLRGCYYDRRYESDNYFHYTDEEFIKIYDESAEFIEKIEKYIQGETGTIQGF